MDDAGPDEKFNELIENKRWDDLRGYLNSLDRVELKDVFSEMDPHYMVIAFRLLHKDKAIELFELLDVDDQARLVDLMSDPESSRLVEGLDPDDRARLFEELPAKVTKRLLIVLSPETRASVNLLLGYPEGSAGRVMTSRYLSVKDDQNARQVLSGLYATPLRPDEMQVIYVIDNKRFYKGYVTLGSLIKASPETAMGALAREPEAYVHTTDSRRDAAQAVNDYDLPAVAVLDGEGRLVGSVTFDDVLDILQEETTEDFQKMAPMGVIRASVKDASVWLLYQKRVPWLLFLIMMNIVTGASIAFYQGTIEAVVTLVFFLPLLMASGGNAGSQSATLIVRSMATGDVDISDWLGLIVKESMIAIILGVTLAFAVSLLGFYSGGAGVAFVVAATMVLIVLIGSLIGMSFPFLLAKLHLDPAASSAPLVTSFVDILGVLIYLTIATWYFGL